MPPPNMAMMPPPNFSMPPPGFGGGAMPPGMMGMNMPPPTQNLPPLDPNTQDIWVETKSPEGKVSHVFAAFYLFIFTYMLVYCNI